MKYLATLTLTLLLFFAACGEKENNQILPQEELQNETVLNWARPGKTGAMTGAYLEYKNKLNIADTLISAESNVAQVTELHESYTTEDGLSGMRGVDNVIVDAGEVLLLEKGGYHLMLMNLTEDVEENDTISVTLNFKQAGEATFHLPVLSSN